MKHKDANIDIDIEVPLDKFKDALTNVDEMYSGTMQHDAHELLQKILNTIHDELKGRQIKLKQQGKGLMGQSGKY